MDSRQYIEAEIFCNHYQADIAFVQQLGEYGLVNIEVIDEKPYLQNEQLADLEKFIHLHYDLDINVEGIEAIYHLLNRISFMQKTIVHLQNELSGY